MTYDPDFLVEYIDNLSEEADSEEEFEGYLGPEDGSIAHDRGHCQTAAHLSLIRLCSLDSLAMHEHEQTHNAELLLTSTSPSLSPVECQHVSCSPLATNPTHSSPLADDAAYQVIIRCMHNVKEFYIINEAHWV